MKRSQFEVDKIMIPYWRRSLIHALRKRNWGDARWAVLGFLRGCRSYPRIIRERLVGRMQPLKRWIHQKTPSIVRDWRAFLRLRPGLWAILTAYIPVRVWNVTGPDGGGPYDTTLRAVMDFIEGEVDGNNYGMESGNPDWREMPKFNGAHFLKLWRPGATVEAGDWSIHCYLLPKYMIGLYEWDGY